MLPLLTKASDPRHDLAMPAAIGIARHLRSADQYALINLAKKLGVKRMFGRQRILLPPIEDRILMQLQKVNETEIRDLELLLNIDLAC